jgi:hypothetical protein
MATSNLDFSTAYRQFYLFDKDIEGATDSPRFWTKVAHESGLALEKGIIGIGIASYGQVRLTIEVFDNEPLISDFDTWDRITEGSIKLETGYLQVLDCPNSAVQLELKLEKDAYRVRVYSAKLASVINDEGFLMDNGDDYYRIELWKAPYNKRAILKKYKNPTK